MKRYIRKPMTINAVQWIPGVEIEGFEIFPLEIQYSLCGEYYTIIRRGIEFPFWFSTAKFDEQYVSENKHIADFGRWEIGDLVYYRRVVNRENSMIHVGQKDLVSTLDPLYQDAAIGFGWEQETPWIAGLFKGTKVLIKDGQWLIEDLSNNQIMVLEPTAFEANFKLVETETVEPNESIT